MSSINTEKTTLWDRVEAVLKNQPIVVVILLLLVVFEGGVRIVEGVDKLITMVNDWNAITLKNVKINCTNLDKIASRVSSENRKTRLNIINDGPGPITASWIDPNGNKKLLSIIGARSVYAADTFAGHAWVIEDSAAYCLGVVTVGTDVAEIKRVSSDLRVN